jgi:D-tyrosyl-tRNA(Tyr) deacylase
MRVVIQRVKEASVKTGGKLHAAVAEGLLVLLGIEGEDTTDDSEWLTRKISQLRIFSDAEGVMNLSVNDIGGDILVVSQFTLHAKTKKGNRPSYVRAASPEIAIPLYEDFLERLQEKITGSVRSGVFGAKMEVALINDGPVTILIDTKRKE